MQPSTEQISSIARIAREYNLDLVLLFGSAVSGGEHPGSDLDIAVLRRGNDLTLREYADLHHEIQAICHDRKVDLSSINHADPLFLKKIAENCRLLYGDRRRLQELKIYAFKRYQDHRHYFEMERAFVDGFVKERGTAG